MSTPLLLFALLLSYQWAGRQDLTRSGIINLANRIPDPALGHGRNERRLCGSHRMLLSENVILCNRSEQHLGEYLHPAYDVHLPADLLG